MFCDAQWEGAARSGDACPMPQPPQNRRSGPPGADGGLTPAQAAAAKDAAALAEGADAALIPGIAAA